MKSKKIVLITKDAMPKHYLPTYGNKYWKTPNIDALAKNGVVFNNFYTCAGSTSMAFYSMITEILPYKSGRKNYSDETYISTNTIFDKFNEKGFNTYLIWDWSYTDFADYHLKIAKKKTNIISLDLLPKINIVKTGVLDNVENNESIFDMLTTIDKVFSEIHNKKEASFVWFHLPHVIKGGTSMGSDIEIFDKIVGLITNIFGKDSIFISADHGNMDGKRGIYGYGFDLDQPVINIPLICPPINDFKLHNNDSFSNIQLFNILNGSIDKEDYIVSDSAYYMQRKRVLSIIHNGYKLIYRKETNTFNLYDIFWDPEEKYDLLQINFYDSNRQQWQSAQYKFYYPKWNKINDEYFILIKKFKTIYKDGGKINNFINGLKSFRSKILSIIGTKKKPKEFIASVK